MKMEELIALKQKQKQVEMSAYKAKSSESKL
jgi:hypothetical protein